MPKLRFHAVRTSEDFARSWRDACVSARREQMAVITEYLSAALDAHDEGTEVAEWAPLESSTSATVVQHRLPEALLMRLRLAKKDSGTQQSDWLRLAMWNAIRAGAKPIRKERAS